MFDIRELPSRANIDARRIEITAILDVPWLRGEEARTIGRFPSLPFPLRICLRSRSSIVACSMKQMHIGRRALSSSGAENAGHADIYVLIHIYILVYIHTHTYIHLYKRLPRVRMRYRYTLQDTLRRRIFTYQSDDGLSRRAGALHSVRRQTARWLVREETQNFPRIPSVSPIHSPALSRIANKRKCFFLALVFFFANGSSVTLLDMALKSANIVDFKH